MSEFVAKYWYLALAAGLGAFSLAAFWLLSRHASEEKPHFAGFIMFGPFWPSVNSYFARRGGLTRRELWGWGIVAAIVVLAVVFGPRRGA
jgi:hypothetical protein